MMVWARQWSGQAEVLLLELLDVEPCQAEDGICLYCKQGIQGHAETCPWLRGRILRGFGREVSSG